MRRYALIFFLLGSSLCNAQSDPLDTISGLGNRDTIPFHYPYYGPRIPPFVGAVIGYEGISNHCIEFGIIMHCGDFLSDRSFGPITGFALTYKQSLSNSLKTIEAEAGLYTPVSIGFGLSGNFYDGTSTFGFRPFIGTSWYHLQVLAGYNFYGKRQTYISELDRFTLKIRYAIPVTRIFKDVTANPGNNY